MSKEESQVIENKRSHLQRLIQMFEHQADSYLLQHRATDDDPISPLGDYSEFDHVDNLDISEATNPIHTLLISDLSTLSGSYGLRDYGP
jgi:hypothetical protein